MAPRTLLLDLDGTLVDSVPDLMAALNRLMRARGLAEFSRSQVAGMVGDGVVVLVGRAFAARGLVPDAAAVGDFSADYGAHVAVDSRPYPGVAAALERLARDGWTLAVCTNKPEAAARNLLAAVGLLGLLRAVGGGDSFPVRKPDPGHLLATLDRAGGSVERAVMVGDHHNDVLAARGAGMPSIFAAWGYGGTAAGDGSAAVALDIAEVPAIAERLVTG